jgi:hypothetical protein
MRDQNFEVTVLKENGEPYKETQINGAPSFNAEEGQEFKVKVAVYGSGWYRAFLEVDGADVGYSWYLGDSTPTYTFAGFREKHDDVKTFKFCSVGSIKVKIRAVRVVAGTHLEPRGQYEAPTGRQLKGALTFSTQTYEFVDSPMSTLLLHYHTEGGGGGGGGGGPFSSSVSSAPTSSASSSYVYKPDGTGLGAVGAGGRGKRKRVRAIDLTGTDTGSPDRTERSTPMHTTRTEILTTPTTTATHTSHTSPASTTSTTSASASTTTPTSPTSPAATTPTHLMPPMPPTSPTTPLPTGFGFGYRNSSGSGV